MAAHVAYDPAVFLTQQEYEEKFASTTLLQSIIERPVMIMMAAGSSSAEDQTAVLQDRIDCLATMSQPIIAKETVEIEDKLRFFVGDHPAQQFERGTEQGGHYKRGGCGCKESMIEDLAHTLHIEWRSLQDLQKIGLDGNMGNKQGF